jgi:hypothetical protein
MYKVLRYCLPLLCSSLLLVAQTPTREKPTSEASDQQKDIDPLALKVLKAVTDPIRDAKTFSFRTRGIREYLGSNGQIINYFNTSDVTVSRPDKLRVDFKGRGHDVQLYNDAGKTVLYAPGPKLYAEISSPKHSTVCCKTLRNVMCICQQRTSSQVIRTKPFFRTSKPAM